MRETERTLNICNISEKLIQIESLGKSRQIII